jgi:serine/threonine protein phosphatase PrpC
MRGAAMTLVAYEGSRNELTWLGAGNVKAALVRHEESSNTSCSDLIVRSGVVGSQLPKLDTFSAAVQHRDVLILATDGIYANFVDSVRCLENLQRQADRILANYHNPNDDALVLVVRLNGMPDTDNEHR